MRPLVCYKMDRFDTETRLLPHFPQQVDIAFALVPEMEVLPDHDDLSGELAH